MPTEVGQALYQLSQDLLSRADVLAAPFLSNPLVVVGPQHCRGAGVEGLSMDALKEGRFLLREPGSATRHTFEAWLYSAGIELRSTQQIASNEAIRLAVASNMGLAVLSLHVVADSLNGVQELPLQGKVVGTLWSDGNAAYPPAAIRFLSYVQGSLAQAFDEPEREVAVAELLQALKAEL